MAVGGGGGGPADLGGGEWVGEHQRRATKFAAGFVGREEGWRRELCGSLGGGGANGGGGGRSRQRCTRSLALKLGSDEEKVKDGSELAGMV